MIFNLSLHEVVKKLEPNFNPQQISEIMAVLLQGSPCTVENVSLEIDGPFKLTFPEGSPAVIGNFLVEIPGIDSKQVKSVTIPKLETDSLDFLTLQLEVFPFKL